MHEHTEPSDPQARSPESRPPGPDPEPGDVSDRMEDPAADASEAVYRPAPVRRAQHEEGSITRLVEQQTAKIPSSVFLVASLASMSGSLALELLGRERYSRFLGQWAPTLLIFGVYNKLVKTFGPR